MEEYFNILVMRTILEWRHSFPHWHFAGIDDRLAETSGNRRNSLRCLKPMLILDELGQAFSIGWSQIPSERYRRSVWIFSTGISPGSYWLCWLYLLTVHSHLIWKYLLNQEANVKSCTVFLYILCTETISVAFFVKIDVEIGFLRSP